MDCIQYLEGILGPVSVCCMLFAHLNTVVWKVLRALGNNIRGRRSGCIHDVSCAKAMVVLEGSSERLYVQLRSG